MLELATELRVPDQGIRPVRELLAAQEEITSRLSPEAIESLLDPMNHIGQCIALTDQEPAHGREVAASIRGAAQ